MGGRGSGRFAESGLRVAAPAVSIAGTREGFTQVRLGDTVRLLDPGLGVEVGAFDGRS